MQHYLLDSNQRLNVSFSKDSVAAYYQCFNQPYRKEVPPLMCHYGQNLIYLKNMQ